MMFVPRAAMRFVSAFVAIAAVLGLAVAPAVAGTITAPPRNFTIPLDASQSNGLGFVTIAATGYPSNTNVSVMICNGNNPFTDQQWDPNVDCDSGTAPAAFRSDVRGTVTFRASDPARRLTFFDGSNPSGTFDCVHQGERGPADGLAHWGGGNSGDGPPCQIMVTTNTIVATPDQAVESFLLPNSPRAGCGSNCQSLQVQTEGATPASQALGTAGSRVSASVRSGSSARGRLAFTGLSLWPRLMASFALIGGGSFCLVASKRPVGKYRKRFLRRRQLPAEFGGRPWLHA